MPKFSPFKLSTIISLCLLSFACSNQPEALSIQTQKKSDSSALKNSAGSGNGDFYGGKLVRGEYIRELPKLACQSPLPYLGKIVVGNNSITGEQVDPQTCSIKQVTYKASDLVASTYQPLLLGQGEGIYQRAQNNQSSSVEVWCRKEGSNEIEGFDLEIRSNYTSGKRSAYFYGAGIHADGIYRTASYAPIEIDNRKIAAGKRLRYKGDDFELDIRTSSFAAMKGVMQGTLDHKLHGIDASLEVECRLGAEMDIHNIDREYEIEE